MLEHLGLVSALTELSTTFARVSGVRGRAPSSTTRCRSSPADAELAVYRIAQESLTNVARHSEASHVTIALERGLDSVVLRVVDDGRGFDGAPEEHGGLRSMRERALLIGGALAIKEGAAGGVEVRLEVPAARVARAQWRSTDADPARDPDPDRRRLHASSAQACKKVLDAKPDLEVVAEAADGAEAVEKALQGGRPPGDSRRLDAAHDRYPGRGRAAQAQARAADR